MRSIAALARAGLILLAMAVASSSTGPVRAQSPDDPERVRELAERMLARNTSPVGVLSDRREGRQVAELYPGRLPDALPFDVPVPPNSQLVGSFTRSTDAGLVSVDVLLEAPGTEVSMQTFYRQQLEAQGWTPIPQRGGGGFQDQGQAPFIMCQGEATSVLLALGPLDAGRTEVRLTYTLFEGAIGSERATTVSAPACAPPPTPAVGETPTFRRDLLPELRSPIGSRLQSGGGAMGPDYATSEAVVETSLRAGELEEAFARQLERAGWVMRDRGDAGAVAYSSWILPHEPEWFGMLAVMATPTNNRYALSVRVEMASANDQSWRSVWRDPGTGIEVENVITPVR